MRRGGCYNKEELREEEEDNESYAVSIQYCPLCGAVLAPNNKEVLEAKQRYYEAKLSEINHHLESLNTTKRPNACLEISIEEYKQLKEEYERTKNVVILNSDFVSKK